MAQQRLFQPALSEVGAPTYVSPGVQDNSMAMLIGGLGGQAVEAYKGYQIAGLEQEQEKAMSAYLNRPSDEAMLGWGEEVQNQAIQIETQWASPSATWEGVNVAEKKLQEAQSKLIRAAEQGIFTPEQLNVRMTANLREAINRNPGLQQELVAQTAKLLEYSGMNALLKGQASLAEQQAAAAKRQADMDDYIYKQTGVNFFANPELKEFAYTTFAKQHEADRLSKEYALRKSKGELNKQELSDFVSDPIRFGNQVTGGLLNMENEYRLWRMENPTADASNTSIAFQNITNKYIAEFSTLLNLPDVRPQVQQAIDMFKDKQKLFEDIARGGVRAEQAENLLKAQRALLSLPNVPVDVATEHALKLAQLMSLSPNPDFDKLQPVFSKLVNNIATYNTTKSPSHNPIIGVDPKTEAGKTAAGFTSALVPDNKELNRKTIDTFLALEQQAMESGTPAAVHSQIVAQVASNWLKTAQQNKTTLGQMLDPTEVVKLQDWVASKMAGFNKMTIDYDPGNKRYVASLDGQINNQATNTLNDLINTAGSLAGYPPYSTETNAAAGQVMSQPQAGQSGWNIQFPANATPEQKKMAIDEAFTSGQIDGAQRQQIYEAEGLTSNVGITPAAERPAAVAPAAPKPATPTGRPARGATKPNATQNTFDFDNIWEGIKDIATFGKAGTSFGGINFTGPADIYPAEKKQTPEQRARNIAALAAADMRSKKVDPDAIQSVTSFLDPVLDAAESVHPSVGYATAALLMFLGSPKAAEALTKKITSKGIKFATPPAGREVVAGSNVMPLNEGASKAVIAAMQGAKKKEAEALFKDYWTTKWQKDRISLPKTDLEWRNAIVEANQYVADRLAKKPLKSMDKK